MHEAIKIRQRMFALVLPIAAATYIGAESLDPKGTDQIITTMPVALKVIPIAAAHPSQLFVSGSLSVIALGGVAVSYGAIAILARKRGSATAVVAVLLGGAGAFCGAIVNVFVGLNLAAAATAHVTRNAAARILIANFKSGAGQAFTDIYALGEFLAPAIMGAALWRSRQVPRWLAVLFALSFELAEQTTSVGFAKAVLQMAPFALSMVLLAIFLWRAAEPAAHWPEEERLLSA